MAGFSIHTKFAIRLLWYLATEKSIQVYEVQLARWLEKGFPTQSEMRVCKNARVGVSQ